MRKKSIFWCIIAVLSAIFLSNCRVSPFDDVKTDNLNQEWAIPLIDTKKSFGDMIDGFDPKAFIQIETDGSVVLRYKGNFVTQSTLDIFASLRDVTFPVSDSTLAVLLPLPTGVHIEYSDIKRGTMRWAFSPPSEPLNVTILIPQLTQNGQAFRRDFNLNSLLIDGIDLKGWRLDTHTDSLRIYTTARKLSNNQPVNLANQGLYQIQNFEFSFAKGYFGDGVFDGPRDSISIDFFDKWKNGSVYFENPRMTVSLDNSFGMPVRLVMKEGLFVSYDGRRSPFISPLTAGVDINYPSLTEVGLSKRTVLVFDKNNSNIADLMSSNPVRIQYDIDGLMNQNRTIVGFMTDTSKFNLQVDVEVPMVGKAKNFEVSDTFDINLVQAANVNKAEFKVITDNGMPIDVSLQGYFLNENNSILDSLYASKSPILRGAPVDNLGLPTGITTTENLATLDEKKMINVRNAKKLIVRYAFSTTNNGAVPVKLLSPQSVRVRIGVKFGLKTE